MASEEHTNWTSRYGHNTSGEEIVWQYDHQGRKLRVSSYAEENSYLRFEEHRSSYRLREQRYQYNDTVGKATITALGNEGKLIYTAYKYYEPMEIHDGYQKGLEVFDAKGKLIYRQLYTFYSADSKLKYKYYDAYDGYSGKSRELEETYPAEGIKRIKDDVPMVESLQQSFFDDCFVINMILGCYF